MPNVVTLPAEYGYVIAVVVFSVFVNFWHGVRVGGARKKFGVKYPAFYLIEVKDDKINQDNVFNCYQRAHGNFLENYPSTMLLMLTGGIGYPVVSALAGFVWLVGRIFYAVGYFTGVPANRMWGAAQYPGLLALLATSLLTASHMLGFKSL